MDICLEIRKDMSCQKHKNAYINHEYAHLMYMYEWCIIDLLVHTNIIYLYMFKVYGYSN